MFKALTAPYFSIALIVAIFIKEGHFLISKNALLDLLFSC